MTDHYYIQQVTQSISWSLKKFYNHDYMVLSLTDPCYDIRYEQSTAKKMTMIGNMDLDTSY